jgi:hypothetical protein
LLSPKPKLKELAAVVALLLGAISHAQVMPRGDVSLQYSHLVIAAGSNVNMDGASLAGAVNVNEWVGLIGDLGMYYGRQRGSGLTGTMYMLGTRISYRKLGRLVPFIQALGGGSQTSSRVGGTSGSQSPFSYAFGAGIDIGLGRGGKVALRPQLEYVGFRYTTDAARVSVGIVYRIRRRVE